jgi:hypothetical protein
MAVIARAVTRVEKSEKLFSFSLLCFFDLENETKNCSQMHLSAKAATLKKSDSKNNSCKHDLC